MLSVCLNDPRLNNHSNTLRINCTLHSSATLEHCTVYTGEYTYIVVILSVISTYNKTPAVKRVWKMTVHGSNNNYHD